MIQKTKSMSYVKLFSANSTNAAITDPITTTTEPVGDGVFNLRAGEETTNLAELLFFGAGADNAAGTAKVYLWTDVGGLWIPQLVLSVDITLGQAVGVAGQLVINTDRFADTLGATSGAVNSSSVDFLSQAGNMVARAVLDTIGAKKLEVRTAKGTATNLNALVRGF